MPIQPQPVHQSGHAGRDDSRPGASAGEPMGGCDPMEEVSRLHDLAVALRAQGQYAAALAASQQALALCEREVGPDHPDVANVLNTLAGTYEDQGHYAEAERLYQRSAAIMETLTGSLAVETIRENWGRSGIALRSLPFAHELTILKVKRNTKGYRKSPPPAVDAVPCTAQRWRVDRLLKCYYRDTACVFLCLVAAQG